MKDPPRTIRASVLGTLRLLDLLQPGGVICFPSTSEAYGDPLVTLQPESYRRSDHCTGPRSSYDESKWCAEAILLEVRRVQGIRTKVARLFNVFGHRTRSDDGRAVSNFISQALRGEPSTVYGHGLQTQSWGYVDDIVDGLTRFFWLQPSDYPGSLNLGNDREVSVINVARYVQSRFPKNSIIHSPPVLPGPTSRRPDLTITRCEPASWSCEVSYEEGVDSAIAWFQENETSEAAGTNNGPVGDCGVRRPPTTQSACSGTSSYSARLTPDGRALTRTKACGHSGDLRIPTVGKF
jgi:nucleoside-diphosphate-sugar epimerase